MRCARALPALAFFVAVTNWCAVPLYGGDAMKPEELITRHLDSLGSKEARTAAKTRAVQGTAVYRILVGGGGTAEGKTGIVSDGRKFRFMMKFQTDYRGETFVSDGEAVKVAFSNSNQSRSPLASFVTTYDVIIRDGLLGGVLSTGWALLNLPEHEPKLVYEGLKKVDGQQVHQLRYLPRKHTEAEVLLYFDAETFRHVKTVYSISIGNLPGDTIVSSVNLRAERSSLEEWFSDFKTVDGLTLPTHWKLQFTRELPNGSTTISEWDLKEDQITNNMGLDPRNFELK